jgi:hypothetical protein
MAVLRKEDSHKLFWMFGAQTLALLRRLLEALGLRIIEVNSYSLKTDSKIGSTSNWPPGSCKAFSIALSAIKNVFRRFWNVLVEGVDAFSVLGISAIVILLMIEFD